MVLANALNNNLVTYTSPTINLKNTGLTNFFTTQYGMRFIPIIFTEICDTQTLAVGTALFNIGWTAAAYSDFQLGTGWGTIIADQFTSTTSFGGASFPIFPASTSIKINVTNAESGTALTGRLVIAGYYI